MGEGVIKLHNSNLNTGMTLQIIYYNNLRIE